MIRALTVAVQSTKIMSRPDVCTIRAYVKSGRLCPPSGCSLSGCNRLTRQVMQVGHTWPPYLSLDSLSERSKEYVGLPCSHNCYAISFLLIGRCVEARLDVHLGRQSRTLVQQRSMWTHLDTNEKGRPCWTLCIFFTLWPGINGIVQDIGFIYWFQA